MPAREDRVACFFQKGLSNMKSYIVKRVLSAFPLLICISFLCFVFINMIPSDPAEVALRVRQTPVITEEAIEQVRAELGLNDPYLVRYVRWVADCLQLDFGVSYTNPSRTVLGEIIRCLPATAMPAYWIGLLMIWFISIKLDLLPTSGNGTWKHLILPSFTVSLTYISTYIRLIRNNMLENMKEDYVLYANAHVP